MKKLCTILLAVLISVGMGQAAFAANAKYDFMIWDDAAGHYVEQTGNTWEATVGQTLQVAFRLDTGFNNIVWQGVSYELGYDSSMLEATGLQFGMEGFYAEVDDTSNYSERPTDWFWPDVTTGIDASSDLIRIDQRVDADKKDARYVSAVFEIKCTELGTTDITFVDPQYHFSDFSTWNTALESNSNLDLAFDNSPVVAFSLNVNQVPVPGAVWLLGSGLVGLMGLRRRRDV